MTRSLGSEMLLQFSPTHSAKPAAPFPGAGFIVGNRCGMVMGQREFIKQVPNRLTGVIIGLVFYYNAEFLSEAAPSNWNEFIEQNMQLIGVLLVGLSILKLSVDWYLVTSDDGFEEKKI
ncbi:uncharacterized protein METZ01_LOCUS379258 [marine metagenome]|uniref:Uncharacterized protein n=1 Tax=marine metagenome TaxID=408172 RepID=A0A382TWG7_9ZZZZ